ncbi:hypothetical protein WCT79_17470 [Pectobacterium carotovorum]|uniref:hypothetical protein n=1 Tax=Pectobacterium carotovorum TaxID=554 RepID=UPI0030182E22
MDLKKQIKFQEDINEISNFCTSSYISNESQKKLWQITLTNMLFILLSEGIIKIKDASIIGLNIEFIQGNLSTGILICSMVSIVMAALNLRSDLINWRNNKILNMYKIKLLNADVKYDMNELTKVRIRLERIIEIRKKEYGISIHKIVTRLKDLSEKKHDEERKSLVAFTTTQRVFITNHYKKKLDNQKKRLGEIRSESKKISNRLKKMNETLNNLKWQLWITTFSHLILPMSSSSYIFYILYFIKSAN